MPRRRARTLVTLACLAGAVVPAFAGTTAASAASCSFSQSKPGGGYFLSLKVTNLSCSKGKTVAKHHNTCRLKAKSNKKGYCGRVDGYKCTEKRGAAIPTEYSSIVTCKKGSKKVVYGYQQDTA